MKSVDWKMAGRERGPGRWFLRAAACALALGAIAFLTLRQSHAEPLAERLLAATGPSTPFTAVLPGLEWDVVCYLDPYTLPSRRLPLLLREDLSPFRYEPRDLWIGENENGLAFLDRESRTVHVYSIDRKVIREVAGPRCLERGAAMFRIEDVNAANIDYELLVLHVMN